MSRFSRAFRRAAHTVGRNVRRGERTFSRAYHDPRFAGIRDEALELAANAAGSELGDPQLGTQLHGVYRRFRGGARDEDFSDVIAGTVHGAEDEAEAQVGDFGGLAARFAPQALTMARGALRRASPAVSRDEDFPEAIAEPEMPDDLDLEAEPDQGEED